MTMPVEIPDDVALRVRAVAQERGVQPEQVVIEVVRSGLGVGDVGGSDNPFVLAQGELRRIAFDGSLRAEIDASAHDPDLAVG